MKINFFSPLPPLPTEIANHTATILPELAKLAEVVVWTDQDSWIPLDGIAVRRFDASNVPLAELAEAGATFYNIGNNRDFHAGIYEVSRRFPGIVILHDTNLQNFYAGLVHSSGTAADYIGLMRRFHGADAGRAARSFLRGETSILQLMASYPLTRAATENMQGVVVHNEAECAALQAVDPAPAWFVPLAFDLARLPLLRSRRPRQQHRLIMFGHIGRNRRVREVLRVLAGSSVRSRYELDIFGQVEEAEAVDADIRALGLEGQVRRHGFVPGPVLEQALKQASLALNLRQPSMGEASASQLRIWAHAIPSLVTRIGWYAALPDDTVGFVDPAREAEDLEDHLVALARDPAPYLRIGKAGRDRLCAVHGSAAYAAAIVRIAATRRETPRAATPAAAPVMVVGHVDQIASDEVKGWVQLPSETETRLQVRLVIDGVTEATAEASQFRSDLLQAGYGDGCYGFVLHARPQRIASASRLSVVADDGGSDFVLHDAAQSASAGGAARVAGSVDEIAAGKVRGWVRVLDAAETRLQVRLVVDGVVEAKAEANLFRSDLLQAGYGDGCYGFVLHAQPQRMAFARRLSVVAYGGGNEFILRDVEQAAPLAAHADAAASHAGPEALIHLDLTDLIAYATEVANVTGIQRVQCGYIQSLLHDPARRARIRFTAFSADANAFFMLGVAEVSWLVRSLVDGTEGFAMQCERARLMLSPSGREPIQAARGHVLLVTGSFWSFPSMLDAIRRLRAETGVVYIQVFYDLVPMAVPETTVAEAVHAFSRSVVRMLGEVDGVLAISEHSAADLRLLCTRLGLDCPPAVTVPMGSQAQRTAEPGAASLAALPPGLGDFVLCVGTIEPRKNHLYLFHLWRRLLECRGEHAPKLVCAGRMGWHTEELQRHLEATANLDGHFVVLPKVDDATLRALYAACRFTIYPSVYEGWGLPVAESLAAGKLCVTSRVTALPEAGGKWAMYIDPHNVEDGYTVVTRLLDDPALIRAAEREIRASYRALSWEAATDGFWTGLEQVLQSCQASPRPAAAAPVFALPARHMPPRIDGPASPLAIARNELARLAFATILEGPDWHQIEAWGVWARGRIARIAFGCADSASGHALCYLHLSVPHYFGRRRCAIILNGTALAEVELTSVARSVMLPIPTGATAHLELTLVETVSIAAENDSRLLGIGLHHMFLCASDDLAGRLDYLESLLLEAETLWHVDSPLAQPAGPMADEMIDQPAL